MAGIQNFKEVCITGAHIIKGVVATFEDGKITPMDALHFEQAAKTIVPAIKDIKQVPVEVADMDDAEAQEVFVALREIFGQMPSEVASAVAVSCAEVGLAVAKGINAISDAKEAAKKASDEEAAATKRADTEAVGSE